MIKKVHNRDLKKIIILSQWKIKPKLRLLKEGTLYVHTPNLLIRVSLLFCKNVLNRPKNCSITCQTFQRPISNVDVARIAYTKLTNISACQDGIEKIITFVSKSHTIFIWGGSFKLCTIMIIVYDLWFIICDLWIMIMIYYDYD